MLTHEQRILANRLADLIVATNRWYAIKTQLRDQRAARMKRTKKREPHVGNKAPILIAHAHEESRCIDRLAERSTVCAAHVLGLRLRIGPRVGAVLRVCFP